MAELIFDSSDSTFKINGSGHVSFNNTYLNDLKFLDALVAQPEDSDIFLPDLFDMLTPAASAALRHAFETQAEPGTQQMFRSLMGQFVGLQLGKRWDLTKMYVVWRTKIEGPLIDEILRIDDGRAFVILSGSKDLLSEHDLYRRTLKTISDHLDSFAADAATIARYTKAILLAPVVRRKVCASSATGIATLEVAGPECLDASQWEMPVGFTFVSKDT